MISRFFISALWVVLAADNQTTRLKQALAAGDDGAARAALQAGADFLEEDGGESAYAVAKRYRRAALAAEMEAIRRRQVAEAFRIERAETTESRQNFLSLQRNPRGNNEIIKPETRTPAAGHVFLILDTVFWHPFPARLDGGAMILMDGKNRTAAPYLPGGRLYSRELVARNYLELGERRRGGGPERPPPDPVRGSRGRRERREATIVRKDLCDPFALA